MSRENLNKMEEKILTENGKRQETNSCYTSQWP